MHTTPTRRSAVACLVGLGLALASCSSAALVGGAPTDTATHLSGTFGGDSNQIPDGTETATDPGTILGGEKNQVPPAARAAADPHESPEVLRKRGPLSNPVSVVTAALTAWSEGDRQAFDQRLADTAHWFGLPLDGEIGRRQFEFQWGFNTTLGARFSDFECVDSGRVDPNSGGTVVECSGDFSDIRTAVLGTDPGDFHGEYAVDAGQLVSAISFRAAFDEEAGAALDFVNAYLTGLGDTYGQVCDSSAGSSGTACAEFILSHLPTVFLAWHAERVS